ncbi:MAG: type II secretion system F family protein [Pseudomonadota bacterium]
MAEFTYKGRAEDGQLHTGKLVASSRDAVAGRLVSLGITPVEIRDVREAQQITLADINRRLGGGRPTSKDMILFCRQMYTITKAGLPLLRGLNGLIATTHNEVLKEALVEVLAKLEAGRDLAGALRSQPKVFSRLFVSLVEVGEATGTLDTAFKRLYEYLQMEQDVKDKVKAAIRYPIVVMIAIAIALGIVTVFVIPNFAPIFRKLGDDMPLPTLIIMTASDFAVNYWHYMIAAVAAAVFGVREYVKTDSGRMNWDRWKLKLPVVGVIMRNAAMARITQSLSVSMSAGLPINQTLNTIAGSIGNAWLSERIKELTTGVERGEALSRVARKSGMFTPLVLQMMQLGEETGALPELMDEASGFYKREVDYDLENLSSALEPILIVFVGGVVLVLALGVFLPMWDMVAKAKAG